ncbi:MAG: hypothetical protein IPI06_01565 [Gammaproteobacteria bacterium]|nr:hypothetical protein [Gammaproteobacteria bacterium]
MRHLLGLALLLSGGATQIQAQAPANGFTPADLAAAAAQVDTRTAELATETEALRLALAYDLALGVSTRTPGERDVLLAALPTGKGVGDLRTRWFVAGAIPQPSDGSTTVLYNPLARGTLVLDWEKSDDGWRVAYARLNSAGPAQWLAQEGPWRKAIVEDYANTRSFTGDAGRSWITYECDRWMGSLASWLKTPSHAAAAANARELIAAGRTSEIGGGNIDLLPERARRTYAPVGAIPRTDGGAAVIFGSPLLPQMLIAADYGAHAALEKLSLVNLGNAGDAR